MVQRVSIRTIIASLCFGVSVFASATYNEATTYIKLIGANEYKNKLTYWRKTDGTRDSGYRHVFELVFANNAAGSLGLETPPTNPPPVGQDLMFNGDDQNLMGTSGSGGGGGGGTNPPTSTTVRYAIYVVHAGSTEFPNEVPALQTGMTAVGSRLPQVSPELRWDNDGSTGPGLFQGLAAGEQVGIHIIADTNQNISGWYINVVTVKSVMTTYQNGTTTTQLTYNRSTYDVQKRFPTLVASIDARRCYGQPNTDGALIADPNADLRNPGFSNWVYKGGLFAGNMPWQTGDQSSTGRIQAIHSPITDPTGDTLRMRTFTCFYMGCPESQTGSVTLGVFPSNVSQYTNPFIWDSRWLITIPENPPTPSLSTYSTNTFTSTTPTQEYCNWRLTTITSTARVSDLSNGTVLAINNEPTFLTQNSTAWRYFASPAYETLFPGTPIIRDSKPRTWLVYDVEDDVWGVTW